MNKKSLKALEFDKIIALLKEKASSSLGLRYINELEPSSDYEEVKYMLEETSEAQSILIKKGGVNLQGLYDIEDIIKNISEDEYNELCRNVEKISQKLKKGYYLKRALQKCS